MSASDCLLPASKVSAARLRLTQQEATEAETGKETLDKVSASVFVRMGLELEDQQCAGSGLWHFSRCLTSKQIRPPVCIYCGDALRCPESHTLRTPQFTSPPNQEVA